MSAEKGKGQRGGFRVFRVHVDGGNLERLRQLFRDFADGKARTKGMLYYRDEWMAGVGERIERCARRQGGGRCPTLQR